MWLIIHMHMSRASDERLWAACLASTHLASKRARLTTPLAQRQREETEEKDSEEPTSAAGLPKHRLHRD